MSTSAQHLVKNLFAALGLEIRKECSETFPRATILLIEPLAEFEPFLRKAHFAEQAKKLS